MPDAPTQGKGLGGKRFLGLNGYVWLGVVALGVVVFIYMRRKNATPSGTTNQQTAADSGLDEGQLASDIGAQVAASLGGTPQGDTGGGIDTSFLDSLFQQQAQSMNDFLNNFGSIAAAGVAANNSVPAQVASAPDPGAQTTGFSQPSPFFFISPPLSPVFDPTTAAPTPAPQNTTTDVSNPATSFFPPGSGMVTADSPAPLYAYSGGTQIAESPIAGSVFSVSQPAASGYQALGVQPSAAITFVPTPITNQNPGASRPIAPVGHNIAV